MNALVVPRFSELLSLESGTLRARQNIPNKTVSQYDGEGYKYRKKEKKKKKKNKKTRRRKRKKGKTEKKKIFYQHNGRERQGAERLKKIS